MSSTSTPPPGGTSPSRHAKLIRPTALSLLLGLGLTAFAQAPKLPAPPMPATAGMPVTYERIRNSVNEPGNWLTYGGGYSGHRYSGLTQITPANVANLKTIWVYQQADTTKWEVTPIVVDGVIYISERPNIVTALDAKTGRILWNYRRPLPDDIRICCGTPTRGLAVLGDAVYLGTFDAHLVCIDASTGLERWDKVVDDYRVGYSITGAPLAVKDKIIVGISGSEFGVRGFLDAYDAKTGERAWRLYTIPAPGEPGHETWPTSDFWKSGGGSTWLTGTYDPELNLLYWGTGNPGSSYNGEPRPGDNLHTDSVIAVDADTGKLRWAHQMTPHDLHDWDAVQVPMLFEANVGGKPRKLLAQANRNGFFYVLDRTNGEFVAGQAFAKQTWAKGLDDSGRPIPLPGKEPTPEGNLVYPGMWGASNWPPPAYNPLTGLMYVNAQEDYGTYFFKQPRDYVVGEHFENGGARTVMGEEPVGVLKAIDPTTGKVVWGFKVASFGLSPVMTTITGLVFSGTMEGDFYALDAKTGKLLWNFTGGTRTQGAPVSFLVEGKQRIAVAIGAALFVFGL